MCLIEVSLLPLLQQYCQRVMEIKNMFPIASVFVGLYVYVVVLLRFYVQSFQQQQLLRLFLVFEISCF